MFAIAALICFVAALFKVHSPVELWILGLAFLAAELAFGPMVWGPSRRWPARRL